jgi:hypothetical protein
MPRSANCAINLRSMRGCARKWLPSLAVTLCWLARASLANAQEKGVVDFTWLAPEGCPSAGSVHTEIDGLLGAAAGARAREHLSVRATVERGALWLVTLETQSGTATGHRTIEAVTCQALASATALIVALMIDPDGVAARGKKGEEARLTPPPAAPPRVALPSAPPTPVTPTPAMRATFGLVGLGASGDLGVLPGPDVDLFAAMGLVRGHWRAELRAAYGLRNVRSDPLVEAGGAYGSFRFFVGTLAGCWMMLGTAVDLGPCAEVELGAVRGEGVGNLQTTSETTPWFGAGAGGALVLKASSWLHFPLHADAVVPLWRPSYVFRYDSPIFRAWPVGGRLTASVEVQF